MALDFSLSETQQFVRDTMRRCLQPFLPRRRELHQQILNDKVFPDDLWEAICDTGLMGCVIPEEYGGNAMGLQASALAIEELAAHGFGNALLILGTMDAACIHLNGSEAVRARYLPKIATGEQKFCFAITEPDAGTNAFRMSTLARRDGEVYRITGSKTFITGADVADKMLLICRTTSADEVAARGLPKTYGLAVFVVDLRAPGIELQPIPTRGIEGMSQFLVFLNDVEVPAGDLVGAPDQGSVALFNSLNPERILAGAAACGMARYVLEKAAKYASERSVFGKKPIGAYQGVAHPLARAKIELDCAQLLTQRAAWAFDQGFDPLTVGKYANMAKHKASEMVMYAVDRAIQTHGGYGFSEEYGLIGFFESARLLQTAPINNELILSFIAEYDLGLPRSY